MDQAARCGASGLERHLGRQTLARGVEWILRNLRTGEGGLGANAVFCGGRPVSSRRRALPRTPRNRLAAIRPRGLAPGVGGPIACPGSRPVSARTSWRTGRPPRFAQRQAGTRRCSADNFAPSRLAGRRGPPAQTSGGGCRGTTGRPPSSGPSRPRGCVPRRPPVRRPVACDGRAVRSGLGPRGRARRLFPRRRLRPQRDSAAPAAATGALRAAQTRRTPRLNL